MAYFCVHNILCIDVHWYYMCSSVIVTCLLYDCMDSRIRPWHICVDMLTRYTCYIWECSMCLGHIVQLQYGECSV